MAQNYWKIVEMKTWNETILNYEGISLNLEQHPDTTPIIKRLDDGTARPKIIVGYLVYDQDCENPLKSCDGMGAIFSRHRHAESADHEGYGRAMGLRKYADGSWGRPHRTSKSDPFAVLLDCYDHGGQVWAIANSDRSRNFPDQQWDVAHGAGVWVPDQCCREDIMARPKAERRTRALEQAKQAVDVYNMWLGGECYGVVVEEFEVDLDFYAVRQDALCNSCWGYIGLDDTEDVLAEEIQRHVIQHIGYEAAEQEFQAAGHSTAPALWNCNAAED